MATLQYKHFVGNMCRVQRTGELCSEQFQEKLVSALQFAVQASVYSDESAAVDLSMSQSILLAIMYSLMKGDSECCLALLEVSESLVQLKSSYLKVWLRDDFNFEKNDIAQMFLKLSQMIEVESLQLSHYISASFSSLIEKYELAEHFSMSGDTRASRLVAQFDSCNSKEEKPSKSKALISGSSTGDDVESLGALSEEEIQIRLRKAVQSNNPAAIVALINAGAKTDYELDNGDTLLHLAVSNSHVEAVNLLLQSGVIPNWRNKDYITPLQMAVGLNNNVMVEALVRSGADVNERSSEGCILLHQAASIGNVQVLKVLVRLGAAVNNKNDCGQTPLHLATKGNHLEVVEALVEAGADINDLSNDGEAALHIAVSKGYSTIVESLVRSGADMTVKTKAGLSPLHIAANRHTVRLLTNGGANINILSDAGDTPLHHAAMNGCIEVAKALIASNANIEYLNKKNATPLSVAVKEEQYEMVRLLVASGANVNFKDKEYIENSLLHWAVEKEKLNSVQLLIDSGANVNIKSVHNDTPLHYAAKLGNLTITELLLNKGAFINALNNKGEGPYHYAAFNGHLQVAQLLLDKGAAVSPVKINEELLFPPECEAPSTYVITLVPTPAKNSGNKLVVPVPKKIIFVAGEDNETVLYSQKAKLFQFVPALKEWKERGTGDVKILKHNNTGKIRFFMRRVQVSKICLNHFITKEIILMSRDEKTWMWYAVDYSEGVQKKEQFAIRFISADVAKEFKDAFDKAQKLVKSQKSSKETSWVPEERKTNTFCFNPNINISGGSSSASALKNAEIKRVSFSSETGISSDVSDTPSFGSVAKTSAFEGIQKGTENFSWNGAGSKLFADVKVPTTVKDNNNKEDDHDPFPLPAKIELKSGEEDEDIIFTARGHLYRFDGSTKEWKERGTGDMKVLKHKTKNVYRLVMRREQIHKLVCNHLLPADFELKNKSENTFVWSALNYFPEENGGKPIAESLAIRFRNEEVAKEFKTVVEDCIKSLKETANN